jgi:hypothetical protein
VYVCCETQKRRWKVEKDHNTALALQVFHQEQNVCPNIRASSSLSISDEYLEDQKG